MKTIKFRRILSLAICLAIILASNALAIGVDDDVDLDIYSDEVVIEHDDHDHEAYIDDPGVDSPEYLNNICPKCGGFSTPYHDGSKQSIFNYNHTVNGTVCVVYDDWVQIKARCEDCRNVFSIGSATHFCGYRHTTCKIGFDSFCIYMGVGWD